MFLNTILQNDSNALVLNNIEIKYTIPFKFFLKTYNYTLIVKIS